MMRIAQFIPLTKLPRKLGCFDYQISSELANSLKIGHIIKIPFAKRKIWGCFMGFINKSSFENIKTIETIEKFTELDKYQITFLQWFSRYHYYSLGSTFTLMQPTPPLKKRAEVLVEKSTIKAQRIEFKSNDEIKKIAKEIITGNSKKYWFSDFKKELKWSLYLELIKATKKQLLILFPSVAVAQTFYDSLPKDIQEQTRLIVSETMKTKNNAFNTWQDIKNNQCKIIVGTRSAIFYLNENIDVIIADQIDSDDYKQWDQAPYYDSIRLLEKAQTILNNKLILLSTKPPIENAFTFKKDSYTFIPLGAKSTNSIKIVDMKKEQRKKFYFLSFQAEQELEKCIEKKQQVLLIINKVGSFSKLICSDCGFEMNCKKCELPFTINNNNELECRHCKIIEAIPVNCPECGNVKLQGRGIGLNQVKNELNSYYGVSEDLENKKVQVLISTGQNIDTSRLENIGAVVLVYFDNLIYLADFNANYRLFCFIQNIIEGLDKATRVIIQTHFPDNEALKYINDGYATFFKNEIIQRQEHNYPPFCSLIKLFFQHHDKNICSDEAQRLYQELLPKIKLVGGTISEPYLYYLNKIRKRYRYILTIKLPMIDLDKENIMLNSIPDFWSIDKNPRDLL